MARGLVGPAAMHPDVGLQAPTAGGTELESGTPGLGAARGRAARGAPPPGGPA